MYAKCAAIETARQISFVFYLVVLCFTIRLFLLLNYIFEEYKLHSLPSVWTSMIQAYNTNGQFTEALKIYREMNETGIIPDEYTYSVVLIILAEMADLEEGRRVHANLKVFLRCIFCVC